MIESYHIHANWTGDEMTVSQCGRRIAAMLTGLACVDALLERWLQTGYSYKSALKHEVKPDAEEIEALLLKERARADRKLGGAQLKGLGGYMLSIWNGRTSDDESVGLMCMCGSKGTDGLDISLPHVKDILDRLLNPEAVAKILKIIVDLWQPKIAYVNSYDVQWPRASEEQLTVRSVIYLPLSQSKLPALPPPSYSLPLGDGTVIFVTKGRFRLDNPEHVEAAARLSRLLPDAEVLKVDTSHTSGGSS